jgi:hypothetical protein
MTTFHQQLIDLSSKRRPVCENGPEMRAAGTLLGAAVVAVSLAACGGHRGSTTRSAAGEWTANAADVIEQLRSDSVGAADGDTVPSARAALHDESRLYALVVAYTDFGGCRHMANALGTPPPSFKATAAALDRACADLQHAAALFTRAATTTDPRSLVAAAHAVRAASPLLERADLELHRASAPSP